QRQDFIADCTDRDRLNDIACDEITTCTETPFNAECNVDVYDSYRAVECHASSTVNPQCDSIITNYCTKNIFGATAGCSTNSAFASARITECITGTNGRSARCQNAGIFTTAGLTECFIDPYGTVCDTALGGSLNDARNNHKTYCTGLGVLAGDNTLCDAAIENVCEGGSANIFDALCFADTYQTMRENTCRTSDVNSRDARCPATVAQLCATNPFTQTRGGTTVNLCKDNFNDRVAFVARCSGTVNTTGCAGVTVGGGSVELSDCIRDPHTQGCDDAVFNEMKTARYAHCISDVPTPDLVCTGVEAIVCRADTGNFEPRANPYHALCRNSDTNYTAIQGQFCSRFARSPSPPRQCDGNFRATCRGNPFAAGCLVNNTYAVDRAEIISNCLEDATANAADCDTIVTGETTVADCAANPFDTANGCNTNAGFERTRTTRTALCSATATPFDSLCDDFPSIAMARTAHCTTAETSFTTQCLSNEYSGTQALRESFCAQPANLFTEACTNAGVAGVSSARTALAELCSTNAASAGCDQFANGVFGATIADCTSDLYNINNGCRNNDSFDALRTARTTLCETSAEYFNPLCNDFPGISTAKEAYCSVNGGSFDANCVRDYPDESAAARKTFARLCRSTLTPRP
ncbi:MAG: hypothetical protein K8953_05575, partial [Proteobacteria bacterium]|nr:hypothetical protein [Pseudomonadota bacterium]